MAHTALPFLYSYLTVHLRSALAPTQRMTTTPWATLPTKTPTSNISTTSPTVAHHRHTATTTNQSVTYTTTSTFSANIDKTKPLNWIGESSVKVDAYRFGYQGQFAEDETEETGYNVFEARMYDSRLGRWFSPDPVHQYWSGYVGMGNNPISLVDPDGRQTNEGGEVRNNTRSPEPEYVTPLPQETSSWSNFGDASTGMSSTLFGGGLGMLTETGQKYSTYTYNKMASNWLYAKQFWGSVETGFTSGNPKLLKYAKWGKAADYTLVAASSGLYYGKGLYLYNQGDYNGANRAGLDGTVALACSRAGSGPGLAIFLFYTAMMNQPILQGDPDRPIGIIDNTFIKKPTLMPLAK